MLLEQVSKALNLSADRTRKFLVSVSGGADSVVLLFLLSELRKIYPLKLRVFHVNFQLRGSDSLKDEKFVQALAKKLRIPLSKRRVKKNLIKTGIQEWARKQRLSLVSKFSSDYELLEAHHLDDQIETFFLRLMRGAGVSGLSCIFPKSLRGNRIVWRPLLRISKNEILRYAKKNKLFFREDKTNKKAIYDRNWLRLKILPLFFDKAPQLRDKIGMLIEEIQEIQTVKKKEYLESRAVALKSSKEWNWLALKDWPAPQRKGFIHRFFQDDLGVFLNRGQILELNQKLGEDKSFSFNAPRGIVIRGFKPSRRYPEGKLKIENS